MQCVALCMEDCLVPTGNCCKLDFQHMTNMCFIWLGFLRKTCVLGKYSWTTFWHIDMSKKVQIQNDTLAAPPAWPEVAWQCFETRTGVLTHGTCVSFWQLTQKLWHMFCALPLPGGKYLNKTISKRFIIILTINELNLVCIYLSLSSTRFHPSSFDNLRKYAKKSNVLGSFFK